MSALPDQPERSDTAGAAGLPELRAALAARGDLPPARIDAVEREILAQREVAATLRELRDMGSQATYHQVDALAPEAIGHLIKKVHTERGRIDGVFCVTDLLALGMLTCVHRCFDLVRETVGTALTLNRIPLDDPSVYDMFCAADTITYSIMLARFLPG